MNKQLVLFSLLVFSVINMTAMDPISPVQAAEAAKTIVKQRGRFMPLLVGFVAGSTATAWALETHRAEIYEHRDRSQHFIRFFLETMQESKEGACRPWQNWWNSRPLSLKSENPAEPTNPQD